MEVTIKMNGQALSIEVSVEVYEYLDEAKHKNENLAHEKRQHWDIREFDEYIAATEGRLPYIRFVSLFSRQGLGWNHLFRVGKVCSLPRPVQSLTRVLTQNRIAEGVLYVMIFEKATINTTGWLLFEMPSGCFILKIFRLLFPETRHLFSGAFPHDVGDIAVHIQGKCGRVAAQHCLHGIAAVRMNFGVLGGCTFSSPFMRLTVFVTETVCFSASVPDQSKAT